MNARVSLRLAHGWSQGDAADRWNERWPDDLKTFKNISYSERWPAASGYTPSLDVLTKLAQLYECHVAELLSARSRTIGPSDPVYRARTRPATLAGSDSSCQHGRRLRRSRRRAHPTPGRPHRPPRIRQTSRTWPARPCCGQPSWTRPSTVERSCSSSGSRSRGRGRSRPTAKAAVTAGAPAPTGETAQPVRHLAQRVRLLQHRAGPPSSPTCTTSLVRQQDSNPPRSRASRSRAGPLVTMHLSVDGLTATGTWEERTSHRLLQGCGVQGSYSTTPPRRPEDG